MKYSVYKIFRQAEWKTFQQEGHFKGSMDDLRDGFIHLYSALTFPISPATDP